MALGTQSPLSPLARRTSPSLLTTPPCPSSGAGGARHQEARPSPLHRCHLPTAPHAPSPEPRLPGTRLVWRRQTHRELKTHHGTEAGRSRFIWREEGPVGRRPTCVLPGGPRFGVVGRHQPHCRASCSGCERPGHGQASPVLSSPPVEYLLSPKGLCQQAPFWPLRPILHKLRRNYFKSSGCREVGLRLALLSVIQRLWANYFLPWIFQNALGRQGKQVGWVHGQSPPLSGVFLQMEVGIG